MSIVGQSHLLGVGAPLRRALESGHPHSMILWGPPGHRENHTGALGRATGRNAEFVGLSAVQAGIKDIRAVVEQARSLRGTARHRAVSRRGASLQQVAAGRISALRRGRHADFHRRDHGESVV